MGLFDKIFNRNNNSKVTGKSNSETALETNDDNVAQNNESSNDGIDLLEKHENGIINDQIFITSFSIVKIFYSTPYGDYKDGGTKLFVLPAKDNTGYIPVFTSLQRMKEFYEKVGRTNYIIIEDKFMAFLYTTENINKGNTPIKLGAVIDPGYYGVTIDYSNLNNIIKMIESFLFK